MASFAKSVKVASEKRFELEKGGIFILGNNPDFLLEFSESLGYSRTAGYLYKDGILRGNEKTKEECSFKKSKKNLDEAHVRLFYKTVNRN